MNKLPVLTKEIHITDDFWDILMRNHVLSSFEVEMLKVNIT